MIQDCAWLCMAEACYSMVVTTINRSLPVCIAVYRCSYVMMYCVCCSTMYYVNWICKVNPIMTN